MTFTLNCFRARGCYAVALWLGLVLTSAAGAADCESPYGENRLACETSPYLLQHAANPVDWYPWGQEAFDKARQEGKFIFLSIGYSTCYWCHVMERESFADPDTAKLLNQYAVSIKVDREERPDLDEIYMTAVQLMTGRGGWPMTTLLTPDLKPFFGGTYLPRAQLQQLITQAAALWKDDRAAVEDKAERIASAVRQATRLPGEPLAGLPDAALPARAAAEYAKTFDAFDGGFGPAPKFPQPSQLELLLTDYETRGDKNSLEMVTTTLDAMARGGIHDQVGGGFHRYATDPQWLVPHFEKMLYDNAQLLHLYARAYKLTGNDDFKRVAEDIVAYVRREMTGPDGLFYSAQDSEVDTEEGKSYVWTVEEIERVLPKADAALARRVWGLDGSPNFAGNFILHWSQSYADTARAENLNVAELQARLAPIRARLLAARGQRPQPHLDDKSITAWNGLMIEALAYAGQILQRPDYITLARRAADALLKTLRNDDGQLLHVARHSKAKLDAYLDDYAATVLALLALDAAEAQGSASATGGREKVRPEVEKLAWARPEAAGDDPRWKAAAVSLADTMIATLWDPAGGFYDTPENVAHLLTRGKNSYDGAVPAGNSLATRALVTLARRADARYAGYAAATLRAYGSVLGESPRSIPYLLWGLADYRQAKLAPDATPGAAPAAPQNSADVVHASTQRDTSDPRRFVTSLHLRAGWHVNAAPATLEFVIPTEIRARTGDRTLDLDIDYPQGEILPADRDASIRVYHDGVRIPARLNSPAPDDLEVMVRIQACNDRGTCLAPAEIRAAGIDAVRPEWHLLKRKHMN
jgi:uncharacterized protein YyaL (SSP411 family)